MYCVENGWVGIRLLPVSATTAPLEIRRITVLSVANGPPIDPSQLLSHIRLIQSEFIIKYIFFVR